MVNDLRDLMQQSVAAAPHDSLDVAAVVAGGRQRVRRRRAAALGGTALAAAAVVAAGALVLHAGPSHVPPAGVPRPDAPTLRLSDARTAEEGSDYRLLASHTNENLNQDNGQYFDGVTDDGLILFRDGPRSGQLWPRFALMDPATGEKDWLPKVDVGQAQTWPLQLGKDRLALFVDEGTSRSRPAVYVFDRATRQWGVLRWPGLPGAPSPSSSALGPDGRLYVAVPATQGRPPKGGWPTGADGEAEDADAAGDTYHLWSASMTDPSDVRDEGLTVGSFAFTDQSLVWTDRTNGDAGLVHVRDLRTGEEHSFDPHAGDRCNLLSFGATDDRVVMGEYCGTYAGGVRDDRVQILDTDGNQVVTLQASGIDGGLAPGDGGLVTVTSYGPDNAGTYVYDLATDRFLRLSDGVSRWGTGGPTPAGQLLWNTPVNRNRGMTEHLGLLLD